MNNAEEKRPAAEELPRTVDEAVNMLIEKLSVRDSTIVAHMEEEHLITLYTNLGVYIGSEFGLWSGNRELLESCKESSDNPFLESDFAPDEIIYQFWSRLQQTHRLRVIK